MCNVYRLVLAVTTAVLAASTAADTNNFLLYNTLEDGEIETRIKWKNFVAKEVTVGRRLGLKFRQLTDSKHFIQLIYDEDDNISDCEFLHQKQSITDFVETFKKDVHLLTTVYNATIVEIKNGKLPSNIKQWMNYNILKLHCKKKHQELRKLLKANRKSTSSKEEYSSDKSSRRGVHSQILDNRKQTKTIISYNNDNHFHNYNNSYHHPHRHRRRRDTTFDVDKSGNYLLFPGTLWCGQSDAALRYTDLGMMTGSDKCCRKHDYCKYNIPGFSFRHGLFNKSPFTLSACRCDMSFRACLKRVGSSDANLVGKLFFNIVQTKCFVFKPKKTCVKRSWWGKCQKKKIIKQAVLRDNMAY